MQARPDTGLGPVPQPAPGRHTGATHDGARYVTPGHALAQDVNDAGQCDPVGYGEPPGVAMSARGSCWQQRGYPVPQFVGDKVLGHDAQACQRIRLSPPGQLDILPA